MIGNWNNYKADYAKAEPATGTARATLPKGAYICEIKRADLAVTKNGQECIDMMIDIVSGEFANYFTNDYRSQHGDKKWRGLYRLFIPGENAESWQTDAFLSVLKAVEDSNGGYSFNGDETTLEGKKACFLFRTEEYLKADGTVGSTTRPYKLITAKVYKTGQIPEIKDKLLPEEYHNTTPPQAHRQSFTPSDMYSAPAQKAQTKQNLVIDPNDFEDIIGGSTDDLPF